MLDPVGDVITGASDSCSSDASFGDCNQYRPFWYSGMSGARRYITLAVLVILSVGVEILDPLVICLAYIIIMKLAVYSQPFAHKFYNKLFHESDPSFEELPAEEEVIH